MKGIFTVFLGVLLLPAIVTAQENVPSINFQNITFSQALSESANTGKPIFVDCYTSWCMPCKKMEKTVFVNDSVYTFYNKHFVNLKIDMEKGEGVDLKKKYSVAVFPTYLFLNSKGEIVHRTTSLMPVSDFLKEAQKALDPSNSYSALVKRYEEGDRSDSLLLEYAIALKRINGTQSQKVADELIEKISDSSLHSELGWKVIQNLSRSENDRLGKYLIMNKGFFQQIAGNRPVQTVLNRLRTIEMYRLIRDKDSVEFFRELGKMKKDPDPVIQRNVIMLEVDYYLETNNVDSFILVAKSAEKGILQDNDADLSFIARRAQYKANGNKKILNEALILARRAVILNPEEYSNQGTLAGVCLDLKLKQEGLTAAKKARALAEQFTSKIQKIAQALVDQLEAL